MKERLRMKGIYQSKRRNIQRIKEYIDDLQTRRACYEDHAAIDEKIAEQFRKAAAILEDCEKIENSIESIEDSTVKEVFWYYIVCGYEFDQIAEIMNYSKEYLKSLYYHFSRSIFSSMAFLI